MKLTTNRSDLLDDSYVSAVLPSGLHARVFPRKGMQRRIAIYGVRYGSIDNDFAAAGQTHAMPAGIAHFLEHEMFKKTSGDLLIDFSRLGASSNAATEYSTTVYFFSCIDHFDQNLSTLTRLVFEPCFRDDWVEKEKKIIEQELRMYRDMPDMRLYQNLQESLFARHPARLDIGGTVQSIQDITRARLECCWRTFYNPSNMGLVIAGDVDPAATLHAVQAQVASLGLEPGGPIRRLYPCEPAAPAAPRRSEKMQVARPKFLMAYKETRTPREGEDLVRREVEMNLALECALGRGSALYDRLYRKGLIDDSFSAAYQCAPSFGATHLGAETDDPEGLEAALTAGIAKFLRDGIRARDMDRIKRRYLGRFLRGFDSVDQCAWTLLRFYFKKYPVFDLPELVRRVSPSSAIRVARAHLRESARSLSVVTPR